MTDSPSEAEAASIFRAYERGLLSVRPAFSPRDAPCRLAVSAAGSALVSRAIAENPSYASAYTWASGLTVVVSDGSSVHGLGDLGGLAVLPILEAKCSFLATVGNLNAVPLALTARGVDAMVQTLVNLRTSFGAVSLEDVSSPRCFELEERLAEELDCPVLHNDQHGTSVAVTAALRNASRVLGREFTALRVVIVGAGAAGIATARLLRAFGVTDLVLVDTRGIVRSDRPGISGAKLEVARVTNPRGLAGGLADAMTDADALVGVSSARIGRGLLRLMGPEPIVLALANPEPEVSAEEAAWVKALYGSGRSDSPNCVSSLLAVPGILKGALAAGASRITEAMLRAAVAGIESATGQELSRERIVPDLFDPVCCEHVAGAVAAASGPDAPRSPAVGPP
ncbi:NAD(P)-dependent malic enzyme [Streptomyces tailanensis]|uniref:NAD(P)-dependent malic enzyme n=1 Tax=Streptomyces tailanensis TaxID=2569858 RepID=UPI00155A6D9E|nr:NADP-dependent malic enzyme [Streptomyces tailanensis]